ncbi:MAG: ABC transporter permease [Muribaculaceae bacterium]|nr:ABC transporter permease [Muribaculaceae bacterium]
MSTGLNATMRREIGRFGSRKIYLFSMVIVPVFMSLFFVSLMSSGLPLKTPAAIVDLDHSPMSRSITRSINSTELIDITQKLESYDAALEATRKGEIFGFFVIPANFQSDALAGRTPTLEYYTNLTYFVPGTLAYKGFKTVAVGTTGSLVRTTLVSVGIDPEMVGSLIQPLNIDSHQIGNPWTNYSYYLTPSFLAGVFALMIMLVTTFSITTEIKYGTSAQWLRTAHDRIMVALAGKLIPQFVVWTVSAMFMLSLLYYYLHFPMNGSMWAMFAATLLFIAACQAVGVLFASIVPNPRLAMTLSALFGVLSFSFVGFSFPVQSMYGAIGVFSWLMPVRYYFLIYINAALNGVPLYYSRWYFVALIVFPFICSLLVKRLKKACLTPVYVP